MPSSTGRSSKWKKDPLAVIWNAWHRPTHKPITIGNTTIKLLATGLALLLTTDWVEIRRANTRAWPTTSTATAVPKPSLTSSVSICSTANRAGPGAPKLFTNKSTVSSFGMNKNRQTRVFHHSARNGRKDSAHLRSESQSKDGRLYLDAQQYNAAQRYCSRWIAEHPHRWRTPTGRRNFLLLCQQFYRNIYSLWDQHWRYCKEWIKDKGVKMTKE